MEHDWAWFFSHYWWLVFPIFGFMYAMWGTSLHYRERMHRLSLLESYIRQGKEPPAELAKILGNGDHDSWSFRSRMYYGPYREHRRAVFLAAVAAGFAAAYYFNPSHNEAFGIVAVIVGVMALGWLLICMVTPRQNDK